MRQAGGDLFNLWRLLAVIAAIIGGFGQSEYQIEVASCAPLELIAIINPLERFIRLPTIIRSALV